jgi:hypothetical protein
LVFHPNFGMLLFLETILLSRLGFSLVLTMHESDIDTLAYHHAQRAKAISSGPTQIGDLNGFFLSVWVGSGTVWGWLSIWLGGASSGST